MPAVSTPISTRAWAADSLSTPGVLPVLPGGRRIRGRRRRFRGVAQLLDQSAELLGSHYLRLLAVDKGCRCGVDAVLLREGDGFIHLRRRFSFHHAHGELALVESRKSLGHVGQLAQQVVTVELLLLS